MEKQIVLVKLDHRENIKFIKFIQNHEFKLKDYEVVVVVEQLPEGDIHIYDMNTLDAEYNPMIVANYEMKDWETNDYVNSIYDRRIFDECSRIKDSGAVYWGLWKRNRHSEKTLKIEAELQRTNPEEYIKQRHVEIGTDLSLSRDHRVHIVDPWNDDDTIMFIEGLIRKVGHTPANKHIAQKKNITPSEWTKLFLKYLFAPNEVEAIYRIHPFSFNFVTIYKALKHAKPSYTYQQKDGSFKIKEGRTPSLKRFDFVWKPHMTSGVVDLNIPGILGVRNIEKAICRLYGDPEWFKWEKYANRAGLDYENEAGEKYPY